LSPVAATQFKSREPRSLAPNAALRKISGVFKPGKMPLTFGHDL
jgi:hypothetical protein